MKVTADDIAQLLASPPPRQVPAHVSDAIKQGKSIWFLVIFGVLFGTFGMIFVWIFFPWRFWDEWLLHGKDVRETSGLIHRVGVTSMSVNETRVYEYDFAYTPEGGPPLGGHCYTTGRNWSEKDKVTVRYLSARPQIAVIEGASLNQGGLFGAFVILFPLVGYGMAIGSLVLRGNPTRLLREGVLAEIDVLSVEETKVKVNDQPMFRITLSAPDRPGGPPLVIRRLDLSEVNLAAKHAERKQPVFVLYDPRKPTRIVFPEALIDQ